jgi:hypothetical protein
MGGAIEQGVANEAGDRHTAALAPSVMNSRRLV